jgi:hypothetical protein
MNRRSELAIAEAKNQRDALVRECQQLLLEVSYRPGCLKLLGLARNHLLMLTRYKSGRQRESG